MNVRCHPKLETRGWMRGVEFPRSDGRALRSWLSGLPAVALGLIAIPAAAVSGAPSALTPTLASTDTPHTTSASPKPTTPAGTPAPKLAAAPADVTADAADRRLTVSWSPVAGAASYKVAARLTNGVEPFAWWEHDTASPPYAITGGWAAMSGLEYEIRVAAVNDDGESIWSPSVAITAPALRPAPADAIKVEPDGSYELGDVIRVHLGNQRPFTRWSLWIWSVCDPDGSGCKLLPVVRPLHYQLLVGEAARGKRVQVQVDYDKDGSSWTATAVPGVVSRESRHRRPFPVRSSLPGARKRPRPRPRMRSQRAPRSIRTCITWNRNRFKSRGTTQGAARSSLFATTCSL